MIDDVDWLQERHDWPGLKSIVMVESTREICGKIEQETRFYITSLALLARVIGPMICSHWAIESVPQLHTRRRFSMTRRRSCTASHRPWAPRFGRTSRGA